MKNRTALDESLKIGLYCSTELPVFPSYPMSFVESNRYRKLPVVRLRRVPRRRICGLARTSLGRKLINVR